MKKLIFLLFFWACTNAPSETQLMQEARQKMDAKSYQEAISLLDQVVLHYPQNHEALNMRGAAYFSTEKTSQALNDFDAAIALSAQQYRYFYNRGNVKRKLNKPQEALSDYDKALALDGTQYEVWLNRALAYRALSQWAPAMSDLDKAAATGGQKDFRVFFYKGKTAFQLEQFEAAAEAFRQSTALQPDLGEAHYLTALALMASQKNSPEACESAKKALSSGYADAEGFLKQYCQ